jgi:predicted transcriptional regulator
MDVLWRRDEATARDVHDELRAETEWAYTTVKTMLERLVEKGAIASAKSDTSPRAAAYRALLSRSQARKLAARGLVARAFGGSVAPLVHFLLESEPLSDADRAALLAKLQETRARSEPGERPRRGRAEK